MSLRKPPPVALEGISLTARQILQSLRSSGLKINPSSSSQPIATSFTLPDPQPIASKLLSQGFHPTIAQRLSELYMINATELKQKFERRMETAFRAWVGHSDASDADADATVLRRLWLATYEKSLAEWSQVQTLRATQLSTRPSQPPIIQDSIPLRRPIFNQRATSVLEEAFSRSAYPTHMEKSRLAAKIGMKFKQINVWFQNRRNRLKREYKGMRKTSFIQRTMPSISSLPLDEPCFSTTHENRKTSHSSARPFSMDRNPLTTYPLEHAPHAFPGPFPPVCDYDPFPADAPSRFDKPWLRAKTADARTHTVVSPAEISKLILSLERLSIADGSIVSSPSVYRSHSDLSAHWTYCRELTLPCAPHLIIPASAPHPALLQRITPSKTTCPTILDPSTISHVAFEAKGSQLRRSTAISRLSPSPERSCVSPPKRAPKYSAMLRDMSHPYHSTSTQKRSSLSRFSSISSLCSDSSTTSMSSSPSSIDIPLLTPPQLFVDLPHPAKPSTSAFMLASSPGPDRIYHPLSPASPLLYDSFCLNALPC